MANECGHALPAIVESSLRHNQQSCIAALLLFSHGNVMQLLEGSGAAVEETMKRISRDPRHFDLHTLIEYPVEKSEIKGFTVGFSQRLQSTLAELPSSTPVLRWDPAEISKSVRSPVANSLLRQFVETNR
jgi:hypothetical protein